MPARPPVAILALTWASLFAWPARGDMRAGFESIAAEVAAGLRHDEVRGAGSAPEGALPGEGIDGHVPEDSSDTAADGRRRVRKPAWLWPLAFGALVVAGLAALRLSRRPGPPT